MTTRYPDNTDGALALAKAETEGMGLDFDGATVDIDPWVKGVWRVNLNGWTGSREDYEGGSFTDGDIISIIVFMAGYPDPMGCTREHNIAELFEFYAEDAEGIDP